MSLIWANISCSTSASWSASWWMPGAELCVVAGTTACVSSSHQGSVARPHGWHAGWWRGTVWPPCPRWLRARAWPAGLLRLGPQEPNFLGKTTAVDEWLNALEVSKWLMIELIHMFKLAQVQIPVSKYNNTTWRCSILTNFIPLHYFGYFCPYIKLNRKIEGLIEFKETSWVRQWLLYLGNPLYNGWIQWLVSCSIRSIQLAAPFLSD